MGLVGGERAQELIWLGCSMPRGLKKLISVQPISHNAFEDQGYRSILGFMPVWNFGGWNMCI